MLRIYLAYYYTTTLNFKHTYILVSVCVSQLKDALLASCCSPKSSPFLGGLVLIVPVVGVLVIVVGVLFATTAKHRPKPAHQTS